MKVLFDTSVYISWIRERKHSDLLLDVRTQKYLSSYVLMELWAGAKTKQASRLIYKLQKPYIKAKRIVELKASHFITVGQVLSDIPESEKSKSKSAGFVNDIFIALCAIVIGANLYTSNKSDFEYIRSFLPKFKLTII